MSSKPVISPGLRRLGIACLGASIAAASAVSKLLEGTEATLDWKQLAMGAGVAVITYALKYRDDIAPEQLDEKIQEILDIWFKGGRDPSLPPPPPEEPPEDLTEPTR